MRLRDSKDLAPGPRLPRCRPILDGLDRSATVGVAAIVEERSFLGSNINPLYIAMRDNCLEEYESGTTKYRPIEQPI